MCCVNHSECVVSINQNALCQPIRICYVKLFWPHHVAVFLTSWLSTGCCFWNCHKLSCHLTEYLMSHFQVCTCFLKTFFSPLTFVPKLTTLEGCSPENGLCCVVFTVACYICACWPDTFNISMWVLSYKLLSGMTKVLQLLSDLSMLQSEPRL